MLLAAVCPTSSCQPKAACSASPAVGFWPKLISSYLSVLSLARVGSSSSAARLLGAGKCVGGPWNHPNIPVYRTHVIISQALAFLTRSVQSHSSLGQESWEGWRAKEGEGFRLLFLFLFLNDTVILQGSWIENRRCFVFVLAITRVTVAVLCLCL